MGPTPVYAVLGMESRALPMLTELRDQNRMTSPRQCLVILQQIFMQPISFKFQEMCHCLI